MKFSKALFECICVFGCSVKFLEWSVRLENKINSSPFLTALAGNLRCNIWSTLRHTLHTSLEVNYTSGRCGLQLLILSIRPLHFQLLFCQSLKIYQWENNNYCLKIKYNNHSINKRTHKRQQIPGGRLPKLSEWMWRILQRSGEIRAGTQKGKKSQHFIYFYWIAGTACKTPGHDHTVNTGDNVKHFHRLHYRLYKIASKSLNPA